MQTIETKRLFLRVFTSEDWPDVHKLAADWSKAPGPAFDKFSTTEAETKGLTEYFAKDDKYYAVYLREAKRVIGLLGLNGIGPDNLFDLGHVFLSKYQDNDLDKEAFEAIIDYIFTNLGGLSIVTRNEPTHKEQLAPLKALGFLNINPEEKGELVLTKEDWV